MSHSINHGASMHFQRSVYNTLAANATYACLRREGTNAVGTTADEKVLYVPRSTFRLRTSSSIEQRFLELYKCRWNFRTASSLESCSFNEADSYHSYSICWSWLGRSPRSDSDLNFSV